MLQGICNDLMSPCTQVKPESCFFNRGEERTRRRLEAKRKFLKNLEFLFKHLDPVSKFQRAMFFCSSYCVVFFYCFLLCFWSPRCAPWQILTELWPLAEASASGWERCAGSQRHRQPWPDDFLGSNGTLDLRRFETRRYREYPDTYFVQFPLF